MNPTPAPRFAFLLTLIVCAGLIAPAASGEKGEERGRRAVQAGDALAMFPVVKCAGAKGDGENIGAAVCYCCKYGDSPLVIVFARPGDKKLPRLIGRLDRAVTKSKQDQLTPVLTAFVNVLHDNPEDAEQLAVELGEDSDHVPIVVPAEYELGPRPYRLERKNKTTVVLAKGRKIVARFSRPALDEKTIAAVMAAVGKKLLVRRPASERM